MCYNFYSSMDYGSIYTLLTKKKIYIWLNIILCTIFFFCLLSTFLNIANLLCNMAAFTVDKNSIMKGLSRLEPFLKIFQSHNLRPFSMLLSYHLANYISKINETTAFFQWLDQLWKIVLIPEFLFLNSWGQNINSFIVHFFIWQYNFQLSICNDSRKFCSSFYVCWIVVLHSCIHGFRS